MSTISNTGNTAEAQGEEYTKCYDDSQTLIVRIIDCCPCTQVGLE